MSTSIRPFIEINQGISAVGAGGLATSEMKGMLIGPSIQNETVAKDSLAVGDIASITAQAKDGLSIFDVAGINSGATIKEGTLSFGATVGDVTLGVNGITQGKLESVDIKYVFNIDTSVVDSSTIEDLYSSGIKIGDNIVLSYDDAGTIMSFNSKIRDISVDGSIVSFTLWDEVSIGDENTVFDVTFRKSFQDVTAVNTVALVMQELSGNKFSLDGTASPVDAYFIATLYVYVPLVDASFATTKISFSKVNNISDHTELSTSNEIVSGTLYNLFKASRTDLSNNILEVNATNFEEILGDSSTQENKLSFAMKRICSEVPGAQMKVYVTEDDSVDAYKKALSFIQGTTLAYSISVLTDNQEVIDYLGAIVDASADPMSAKYKMGFISQRTPYFAKQMEITDYTIAETTTTGVFEIVVNGGGFASADIQPGDKIYIGSKLDEADSEYYNVAGENYSNSFSATVTQVVTDNKIIAIPSALSNPDLVAETSGETLIVGGLNAVGSLLAELIKERSRGINNKGMVSIFPDKASFIEDGTEVIIPGYFTAAIINGVVAHLPPQQGISNLALKSINRVIGSSFVFTEDELDNIASDGTFVLTQESITSDPYVLRQLTTDMTSLDTMEISKVRCLDKATFEFKASLDGYVGKRNVNASNVTDIQNELRMVGSNLVGNPLPLIGAILNSFEIISVSIPEDEKDSIVAIVDVETPSSLNKIRLNINSK